MLASYSTENLREVFFFKAQEALAIFDKDLNFVDVNETFLKSIRLPKSEIIGKNVCDLSPGVKATERYQMYLKVIETGESNIIEEVRLHPSLGNFINRISIFKVGEGMGLSALDITDLKEAVEDLETFIYKSSHDMRAPIASILGLMNLAVKEETNSKSLNNYLSAIKQQTELLNNILKKLVKTTRIRQGVKSIHLIDFEQLLNDVIISLNFLDGYDQIKIEKNISVKEDFYSDTSLIISLVYNILENAIKYKKDNIKNPFIKISVIDEFDGVKITCEDNGIGIAMLLQKNIFNMFFRATDKSSGSGLGLYTVKHCIKKLGGQIKVDSQEHLGSKFILYIPNDNMVLKKS